MILLVVFKVFLKLSQQNFPLFELKNESSNEKIVKDRGLSELVRLCFGKPLNKADQISNWEKRPLRKSQIYYAALDALCVLEVLIYFSKRLKSLKVDFDINKCIGKKLSIKTNKHSNQKQIIKQKKDNKKQLKFEIYQNEKYQEEVSKFQVIYNLFMMFITLIFQLIPH